MMSKFWYSRGRKANDNNITSDHEQILFTNRQTDDPRQNLIMNK